MPRKPGYDPVGAVTRLEESSDKIQDPGETPEENWDSAR
jgi:hypothetical protein